MNQILIVDDEKLISKGIKHLINYSAIDIDEVYVSSSGYEALDILKTHDITLIITDIKMEGMSGLELMHEAKLLYPWIQVIVISAFEDFAYAQKAIQLGAKDYLIKPLNPDHLVNSIRNCLLNTTNKQMKELTEYSEENYPNMAIYGIETLEEISEKAEEASSLLHDQNNIELNNHYYSVIQIKLKDTVFFSFQDKKNILAQLIPTFDALFDITIFIGENIYLLVGWDEFNLINTTYSEVEYISILMRNWQHIMKKQHKLSLLIGYSQTLKGRELIGELVEQTNNVLNLHKEESKNDLYYYGDYNWSLFDKKDNKNDLKSDEKVLIKNVKNYLKEHYTQHGLSLKQIAEANHISANYLSSLFKEETGHNIWDYLIQLRMEESKYLWLNTDMKLYEISEYMGYESSNHFSKVFKKYFKESPMKMKTRLSRIQ